MRRAIPLALGLVLLGSGAQAQAPRGECRTLTKQIAHFEGVAQQARARNNRLWEQETRRHVARLEKRRAHRCPQFAQRSGSWSKALRTLARAGRTAAAFLVP